MPDMVQRMWLRFCFLAWFCLASVSVRAQPADANAEARVFFERGNRLLDRALRARGERRQHFFEQALQAYVESLRIVRSRNALYNAAGVLESLGRAPEAYGFYREFLAVEALSDAERQDALARLEALSEQVLFVELDSTPEAEVFVDRTDLGARGTSPGHLALAPGSHRLILRAPHHRELVISIDGAGGTTREIDVALEALPCRLEVEVGPSAEGSEVWLESVPENSALERSETEDTTRVLLGTTPTEGPFRTEVSPGAFRIRLVHPDFPPVERRVELHPGEEGRVGIAMAPQGRLVIPDGVEVLLDGQPVAPGPLLLAPGAHRIEARAPDRSSLEETIAVAPHETQTLRVTLGEAPRRRFGALPAILAAGSGVTLAAGAVLGIRAMNVNRDGESRCRRDPSTCDVNEQDAADAKLAADVSFGVGAALGVSALFLFLFRDVPGEPSSIEVDAGLGAVQLRGRF